MIAIARIPNERRALWLARVQHWTDLPLMILALLLIPILIGPYLVTYLADNQETLNRLNYLIWGVFAADLGVKVLIAPNRRHFLRTHWFDVVIVALPVLRPLRLVRPLLMTLRAAAAGIHALTALRRILARHGLQYVLLTALVTVIVTGSVITYVERNAPDSTIRGLPDGLWWAITTISTVGYGDTYPATAAGRGIGVALMLLGVAIFGVVTASLASHFVARDEENVDDTLVTELREIKEQLRHLQQMQQDKDS